MTLNQRLRGNLRRIRLSQKLTQQALAEKAGVEYKYYQRIESGDSLNLTFQTLEKLTKALKVDVTELFRRL